jgi:hypothetical protein
MKSKWFLVLIWLSLTPWAVSQTFNAGQIERTAQQLTHALLKQGFEVNRGYVKLWTIEDCLYTYNLIGFCGGNNPAAPYIVVAAPPWPDEAVIPQFSTLWGPSPPKYEDVFRFDPREALIILVQMPPPARFFSEQSWMWTRQGTYNINAYNNMKEAGVPELLLSLFFKKFLPPDDIPERVFVGASLSNTINNIVIERRAGTSFGQQRYFIITPDGYMNTAVRNAFAAIAVADEAIFTEQIPSNVNVGLDLASDDFVTWLRYAQPDDGGGPGTPSYIWKKNLPIAVLRVRHTEHPAQPYPAFTTEDLEARTAFNEKDMFSSDLHNLVSAVSSKWGQPCATPDCSDKAATKVLDMQTYPVWGVGPLCMAVGENCLLDNWDMALQLSGQISVDQGKVYAVAGTLGTRTGNATYVGFGINKASQYVGVANLSDEDLKDTASGYEAQVTGNKCPAVNNTKTTDCLFLYYFTRDCSVVQNTTGEKNCMTIDEDLIPPGDVIAFSFRDYVRPGTARGPDSSFVLPPMVIRVH